MQALIDAAGRRTAAQVRDLKAALAGCATRDELTAAVAAVRQLPAGGADGQVLGRASGAPAWAAPSSVLPETFVAAIRQLVSGGADGQVLGHESGAPAWVELPSPPDTLVRVLDPWPPYPPESAPAGQPFFKGLDEAAAPRGWYEPAANPVQPLNRFRLTIGNGPLANQHGYANASAVAALSTSFGAAGDPEAGRNVAALFWRNTTGSETTELRLRKAWVGRSPADSLVLAFSRTDTGVLVNSITVRRNAAADTPTTGRTAAAARRTSRRARWTWRRRRTGSCVPPGSGGGRARRGIWCGASKPWPGRRGWTGRRCAARTWCRR